MSDARPDEVSLRFGRLRFSTMSQPTLFVVAAFGYIGPTLLREDLRRAVDFGQRHPQGWVYVADISGVRLANPTNLALLGEIPKLPHIAGYVVVAPSRLMRLAAKVARPLTKTDFVVRTREQAVAAARELLA